MKLRLISVTVLVALAGAMALYAPHKAPEKVAVFGRTMLPCPPRCTWDGKVAVTKRSDPTVL